MSWTPCGFCGAPLTGYAGSPCTNPECIQHEPAKRVAFAAAPLAGQVRVIESDDRVRVARKARRKAQREARRRNRR